MSALSARFEVVANLGSGWRVQQSGLATDLIRGVPFVVACACARHLNGQSTEAGDVLAMVDFIIEHQGGSR